MKYKKENKDISYVKNLTQSGEVFKQVTPDMVDGVYDYYQISNFGRVYHNYLHIIMKPGISTSGYKFIVLSTINGPVPVQLHRLVLIAFNDIENRDLYQANHKSGNKMRNYIWNLEWATRQENILHAYNTGLHHIGEDNVHSTISNETAENICKLLQENKYTNEEIANITNTTISVVAGIKQGKTWKHISCNYNFISRPGKLFTEEQIHNLCKYFENHSIGNLTVNDHSRNALAYYGYNTSDKAVDSIRKLYTHKYYINISKNYNF